MDYPFDNDDGSWDDPGNYMSVEATWIFFGIVLFFTIISLMWHWIATRAQMKRMDGKPLTGFEKFVLSWTATTTASRPAVSVGIGI